MNGAQDTNYKKFDDGPPVPVENKNKFFGGLKYIRYRRERDGSVTLGDADVSKNHRQKMSALDSHTYEPDESEVWRSHQAQRHFRDKGFWWTTGKRRAFKRWWLTFIVGVITGLVAIFVTYVTNSLSDIKFQTVNDLLDQENAGLLRAGTTFLAYAGFNLFYVLIASFMVYIEPFSAGSGIPEVKSFLNGVDYKGVIRVRTLICKVLGVMFSVAGGLPAGKEGPMVHSGSVLAAGASQGKSQTLGFDTSFSKFQDFRNDKEKRDFVACGAAAGVAAAFGSPIGGVLFSLEEGASFWSTKLTWRCFFCAMMTVMTLYVVKNAEDKWLQPDQTKMFSFGEFYSLHQDRANYTVWELLLFVIIGCMGGLIGALFNATNERLTIWRMKHVRNVRRRVAEALLVAFMCSAVSYVFPLLWRECTPRPVDMESYTEQEKILVEELVSFNCKPTEYNQVASLFFTDADTAIKQLFHFREVGEKDVQTFSSGALFVFFCPYVMLACWTYGIGVPSGLFVPSLLSGAAFGRLFGHLLHKLDNASGTFADSGTYALIGAAAVLGGMARMTISLSVILLEATGDMQYVLPLMLTLMAARWVGNVFNESLYDMHIHMRHVPFLEEEAPFMARMNDMCANQIMSVDVKCLRPVEKVGVIYDLLTDCSHNCFPVVDIKSGSVLVGTVLRKLLTVLIQQKAFGPAETDPQSRSRVSPLVHWGILENDYPRYPKISELSISPSDRDKWIDLRPYANTSPYLIHESASVQKTYRLFRTLGLRHLCVVNSHNQVIGMITRKDLLSDHIEERLETMPRTHVWENHSIKLCIDDP
mmetsp:Transcript_31009/g.40954  ORF Transcript_31009/g.40954 Transcript_31009/m.40954 type:complete len:814 (+) Transcript_31009:234-2675(+)